MNPGAKKQAVVVVPCYRVPLRDTERTSLQQCVKVLGSHPIVLIVPANLNVTSIQQEFPSVTFKKFPSAYFKSIESYNKLMMSPSFYRRFEDYRFMLICQLDAYVFSDQLEYWCKKDYDYIGAPWFKGYHRAKPGDPAIGVGNGGFSLRKIESFIRVLTLFSRIKDVPQLMEEFRSKKSISSFWKLILNLTVKNNTYHLLNDYKMNEDHYMYHVISKKLSWFKIPPVEEALEFAVETNPSYHIERMGKLPFGCHAWPRFEPEFWKKYIATAGNSGVQDKPEKL